MKEKTKLPSTLVGLEDKSEAEPRPLLAERMQLCPEKKDSKYKNSAYRCWATMKQRCLNPNNTHYDRYGERGISICDRWMRFDLFIQDMGQRPSPFHTIERIDNDGNYCPENCRWATRMEQSQNTKVSYKVCANGESLTLSEWARRLNIPRNAILFRIRRGWDVEKAVTVPPLRKGFNIKMFIQEHHMT